MRPHVTRSMFPQDEQTWIIRWIGALQGSKTQAEFEIDVALAPLLPGRNLDEPRPMDHLDLEQPRFARIGVGALPSLIIGSRWQKGRLMTPAKFDRFSRSIRFRHDNMQIVDAGMQLGEKSYLIPRYAFPLPNGMLGSQCVAVGVGDDPYALIIPCHEVLRAWLLRSSAMALRLLAGPFNQVRDKLFDASLSGELSPGHWRVQLRTGLSGRDLLPVALLACDPNARAETRRMFDNLMHQHLERKPRWIRLLPPAQSEGPFAARGLEFRSGGRTRFLVFDILKLPFPNHVQAIDWDLDNSNLQVDGDGELDEEWRRRPPGSRQPSPTDQLVEVEEPQREHVTALEEYLPPELDTQALVTRLDKEEPSGRGQRIPEPGPDSPLHATGPGTYGGSASAPMRIVAVTGRRTQAPVPAAAFADMMRIAEEINRTEGASAEIVRVTAETTGEPGRQRSLFPVYERGSRRIKTWCFIAGRRRQLIGLRIFRNGHVGYALEIERAPSEGGERRGEQYQLLLLVSDAGGDIDDHVFETVINLCLTNSGVWPNRLEGHRLRKFKHTRSAEAFAMALVDGVAELAGVNLAAQSSLQRISA